jgi:hypothetical protein
MERILRERQVIDAEETTLDHPDDACAIMPEEDVEAPDERRRRPRTVLPGEMV